MDKSYTEKIDKVLKRIRENRKTKGYSHDYMAAMLDISPSAYNKLERNETNLSLERLLVITDILELPITEVLDIKTGDTYNQDLKDNSIGRVETLNQDNKDKTEKIEHLYQQLLKEKDETIKMLKELVTKK
ncbi:MAG TPA: helix-turn-helix transcriptional regulator [Flavobacterium sp.]|uniref:helix-turn-helix domain-containing protein n=1 Tax=Avrilella dinanensis TaxID=2008672 RepID=UPI002409129F|nr:helix-turn-helix transcriptional regulator [Avrilella dinanensis]HLW63043.1 helix-turn-helix transcriptional regulator [Flavobacterium sp.]